MSLNDAASLLRQYNKKSPYTRTQPIDTKADEIQKFGTWSYANMYDALYNKFSQYKNFNMNMWQDALRLNEQDQYLAFLEQNKDAQLSDQFYDPEYYDYESMMLEMYLPFANRANIDEMRTTEVFDPVSGDWIQQEIGAMSDYDYIKYQIDSARKLKQEEIKLAIEDEHKKEMSWIETVGHDALATLYEIGEGALGALTTFMDVFGGISYATLSSTIDDENWFDAYVKYFAEEGITAAEQEGIRARLDEYERTHTHFRDINGNITGAGTYVASVANSIGMMVPAIVTNIAGAPALLSTGTFYTSIFGRNVYENATNPELKDTPSALMLGNALVKTGVEAVIEYALGQVLGGTVQNSLIGLRGKAGKILGGNISKVAGLGYIVKSAAQEGLEEFLQDFSTTLVDQFLSLWYKGYANKGFTVQALIDAFFTGALSSLFMSGGQIGLSEAKGGLVNLAAKKKGLYNERLEVGPGDMLIEQDGKLRKLRGWNRLYYSSILSDFNAAVEKLKKGKFSAEKNIELAQEVYGALSVMAQYYSSFDAERLANCKLLLDNVVNAEKNFEAEHDRAFSILSDKTKSKIISKNRKSVTRASAKELGIEIGNTFEAMYGGAISRAEARRVEEVLDKYAKKLAEGEVTDTEVTVGPDGIVHTKDGLALNIDDAVEMAELEALLGKQGLTRFQELSHKYEWVFATNGHVAVDEIYNEKKGERKPILFVPIDWLKNYEADDIGYFLRESDVLEALVTDTDLNKPVGKEKTSMIDRLVKFVKEYTNSDDVTKERAMMQFLFNKSVYQAFLLSQDGRNLHDFGQFVAGIYKLVEGYVDASGWLKRKNDEFYKDRVKTYKKMLKKMKAAMREANLKAILNWHIDAETIYADVVLDDTDREFIQFIEARRRMHKNAATGTVTSAYQNLAEDLIENSGFKDEEKAFIRHALYDKSATEDEKIEAVAMLDYADLSTATNDFAYNAIRHSITVIEKELHSFIEEFVVSGDDNFAESKDAFNKIINEQLRALENALLDGDILSTKLLEDIEFHVTEVRRIVPDTERIIQALQNIKMMVEQTHSSLKMLPSGDDAIITDAIIEIQEIPELHYEVAPDKIVDIVREIGKTHDVSSFMQKTDELIDYLANYYKVYGESPAHLATLANDGLDLLKRIERDMRNHYPSTSAAAITIPIDALVQRTNDKRLIQHAADVLKEFETRYGISAHQVISGVLTDMTIPQRHTLEQDMQILGTDNLVAFVIRKLESMLGDEFIVTPTYEQYGRKSTDTGTFKIYDGVSFGSGVDYTVLEENLVKERDDVRALIEKIKRALYRSKKEDSDAFYGWMDKFYDTAMAIFSRAYSAYSAYQSEVLKNWSRDFAKRFANASTGRESLEIIVAEADVIDEHYNTMLIYINEDAERNNYGDGTGIYDFVIGRKISVSRLLNESLRNLTSAEANAIIEKLVKSDDYSVIVQELKEDYADDDPFLLVELSYYETDEALNELYNEYRPQLYLTSMFAGLRTNVDLVDPITGEFLGVSEDGTWEGLIPAPGQEIRVRVMKDIILAEKIHIKRPTKISDLMDLSIFEDEIQAELRYLKVKLQDVPGVAGYYDGPNRTIVISRDAHDKLDVFVHEFNHALQHLFNLPNGFSPEIAFDMPEFLEYVFNHYKNFVALCARMRGLKIKPQEKYEDLDSRIIRTVLPTCAYLLVQGEIWARSYMHNGKPIHGFAEIVSADGLYLLAPDGKTKFKVPEDRLSLSIKEPTTVPTPILESALSVTVSRILEARHDADIFGYSNNENVRNTYHSKLVKQSPTQMLFSLLRDDQKIMAFRVGLSLDDLIKDPESFLREDVLSIFNGDFSEGNVFYGLKDYIERTYSGISIDRDDVTHKYILVSDNNFDDLLRVKFLADAEDFDSTSIAQKYANGEPIPIKTFYRTEVLNDLGIDPDIPVIISPNVRSETTINREYQKGLITIYADKLTSNAKFIDTLNHEFRHLMQYYSGFESGFTPRFKVTKEMIADVKKHAPELFKNEQLIDFAQKYAKVYKSSLEEEIVRQFVYALTGGELNAYGLAAELLVAKPIYVSKEAGSVKIFMPWYDAKTGEGAHKTDYLAMLADDTSVADDKKKSKKKRDKDIDKEVDDTNECRRIDAARRKLPKEGISFRNMAQVKEKEKTKRSRYVPNYKARESNLKYYIETGKRIQLDPAIQDFIIATTGHEDEVSHELMSAILDGTLTRQSFEKWFRKVNLKQINDFTFNLINKYIYKNEYITSMQALDNYLTVDPQIYWALNVILLKHGAPLQELVQENNLDTFMEFIKRIENSKWWTAVQELSALFDNYSYLNGKGELVYEHIGVPSNLLNYMRVYAMEYFDGSLAGAFKTAHAFRKTLFAWEDNRRAKMDSLDATINDENSDDKAESRADKISEADIDTDRIDHFGNDILAIYAQVGGNLDDGDMINYIVASKYLFDIQKLVNSLKTSESNKERFRLYLGNIKKLKNEIAKLESKEKANTITEQEKIRLKNDRFLQKKFEELTAEHELFREALYEFSTEELVARYSRMRDIEARGGSFTEDLFDLKKKFARTLSKEAKEQIAKRGQSMNYTAVKGRVDRRAQKIINFIVTKQITFESLPENVRELFEYVTVTESGTRRKIKELRLKKIEGITEVGRGRAKLLGKTDSGREDYVPKHDITAGTKDFRHDVEPLLKTEKLFDAVIAEIEKELEVREKAQKDMEKKLKSSERENERLRKRLDKTTAKLEEAKNSSVTNFVIEKKKKTKVSDTPNQFDIISAIPMPDVLRTLLDVSFEKMADTKVKFVSKDKDGNIYDPETMKPEEFKSAVKHEVANWEAFYETVRGQLLALTRSDALDIIEFFERGCATLGPVNKLAAFEIFILGYLVDVARNNSSNWNFSDAEIEHVEKLYENRASIAGSMLNAVKVMREVVNPFKTVQSRMLDSFVSVSDDDKNDLTKDVEKLQRETDRAKRIELADELNKKLNAILRKEFTARNKAKYNLFKKEFWDEENLRRLGEQVRSFRYSAMLSSPITWLRNQVSNATSFVLNSTADFVARIMFTGKGYRDDQWDLTHTKISPEVKAFIDEYIKKNPIFNPLYDMSGKYDERQKKQINAEKELFVGLITYAMEQKYAANYRFDNKVMNWVSRFINGAMSDQYFVKFVTSRYFGKMLTIEVSKGNIDLSDGLSNKVLNLFADAVIAGNQEYMHKRSFLADSLDKMRDEHEHVYNIVQLFFPFLNSSFNWFTESLKYTPFGLIGSIRRLANLEQQINKLEERRTEGREMVVNSRMAQYLIRRDIGKGIVGILLSIFGALLAISGRIKLEEDDEKLYVIAGDVKVDMSSIFGTSSVLVGASIAQHWIKQGDDSPLGIEKTIDLTLGYMLDDFFIDDLIERHRYDQNIYEVGLTELSSFANSFTPRFWQLLISTFNNEKIKYSSGFKNVWERWINSFVPTQPAGTRRIDPYTGEVVKKHAYGIAEVAKSAGVHFENLSENERMCRELGVNKNELTGELTVRGTDGLEKKVNINKESLNTYYGKLNNTDLAKIKSQNHTVEMPNGKYQSLSWDDMSDIQKARVLDRTMEKNAKIAKIYVWTQVEGHKFYANDAEWNVLRKLGLTKNVYKGGKGFVE